ncbi:hypothetical protein LCGC14_0425570 [marine sediment metagenome]|uniref:Uncharacterized protein n=1 Tax=marine sediment metagenome TaxID=412755 RepID=A0A0F9SPL4_9ZZZZ
MVETKQEVGQTKPLVKTKWTEQVAVRKLVELQNAGPKYAVCDEMRSGKVVDTMLDVCGFANLKISARGKFFQLVKRLSSQIDVATGTQRRFYCEVAYRGGGWLSIYDSTNRQEMSVNVAACKGHQQVLAKYGIKSRVVSTENN